MEVNIAEIDLQKAVLEDYFQEISKDINQSVMNFLMMEHRQEQGWIPVKLSKFQDNRHAVDITWWLHDQGLVEKDDYYREGSEFLFREARHATMFTLRWMQ